MLIKKIKTYEELQTNINSYKYIILNISAVWCAPCMKLKPNLEKFIAVIDEPEYIYLKLDEEDYSDDKDFEKLFHLQKIPYFAILKDGFVVNSFVSGDFDFVSKKIYEYIKRADITEKDDNYEFKTDDDF
jgi:thiol-disulfide isomerase/thioredoxin